MVANRMLRVGAILFTLTLINGTPRSAIAGTFPNPETMVLKYAWCTSSLAEFDYYDTLYPSYLPTATITYAPDGTFFAVDNGSGATGGGVYDVTGLDLTLTLPPSYVGNVEYVGEEVAPGVYAGEIRVNGATWGHWRGEL